MVDSAFQNIVPANLKGAIETLAHFPSVVQVEAIRSDPDNLIVDVQWAVTLPTKFHKAGVTTVGVKSVEPVQLVFPSSYPLDAPRPTLRQDFPTSLPHINPFKSGDRVPPCIAELSMEDLLHSAGLEAILRAMGDWLDHAASGELHCPVQGWEAVRRDSVSGIISTDTYAIRSELDFKNTPARFFEYRYFYLNENHYGLGLIATPSLGSSNSDFKSKQTFILKSSAQRYGPALVLQTPKDQISSDYWPETVSDYKELKELAKRLNLLDALEARVKYLLSVSSPEVCRRKDKRPIEEFLVIFAVRRPFKVIGTNSYWELLPYRVLYGDTTTSHLPNDAMVYAPFLLERTTPALLQDVAGKVSDRITHLTLIGCGSVGSKLSLHLAKTGRYNFRLMDEDYFSSHNNARHGVIADGFSCIGARKTSLVESEIRKLNVDVESISGDIIKSSNNTNHLISKNTDYIIDTTASLRVRHWLSHKCEYLPGRLIHVLLYGNAAMGVMAIEGTERSVRIDDQTAYLNTLCVENDSIQKAMYGTDGLSRQVFSGGCSSVTARMNDMDISLLTTGLTSQLDRYVSKQGINEDGFLTIGLVDDDLGLSWRHFPMSKTIVIPKDKAFDWNVRILGQINQQIAAQTNADIAKEQGGVLAGYVCPLSKTIYITHLVPAPSGSVGTSTRFWLNVKGLKETFQQIHSRTNGQITFLGTWHSHTTSSPPSQLDRETLSGLTNNYDFPIVMLTYTGGHLVRV
jgi:molybdopterin/thiamine biosynthesis adenylyltransferase